MARRSARLKGLKQSEAISQLPLTPQVPSVDSDSDDDVVPSRSRKSKTGKAAAKRPVRGVTQRGSRGKLRFMLEMPLDIVMEICCYLSPKDLLHLSRTSKETRTFFMSRGSIQCWKEARLSVPGLPPCPPDLSEPQYANLMFDTRCHACLQPNSQHIYWQCRVRWCRKCSRNLGSCRYDDEHNGIGEHEVVGSFLSDANGQPIDGERLRRILPVLINDVPPIYYKPHWNKLVSACKETPSEGIDALLELQRAKLLSIRETADALEDWYSEDKLDRAAKLEELRLNRKEDIKAKLTEDGWERELEFLAAEPFLDARFKALPEVSKPQALTPRIWKNINGAIVKYMGTIREERERRIRKETLERRLAALDRIVKEWSTRGLIRDVSATEILHGIPEVQDMLSSNKLDLSSQELENALQTLLPRYIETRLQEARKVVGQMISQELGLGPTIDPFSIAISSGFMCSYCSIGLPLHRIVGHICAPSYSRVWDPESCRRGVKFMKTLIETCGLDPKVATVDDMDGASVRVICRGHKLQGYAPFMTWRSAWQHGSRASGICTPEIFDKATEEQMIAAKPLEPIAHQLTLELRDEGRNFRCAHCGKSPKVNKKDIKAHLSESHGIEEATEHDWVDEDRNDMIHQPVYLAYDSAVLKGVAITTLRQQFKQGIVAWCKLKEI
ncbi:hypothetical protein BDW22DRAFT_1359036 [Trametopsis cervina]|nr:hypothetical protein BDW22DRAFT_1359036 [Trametopsis cervina]